MMKVARPRSVISVVPTAGGSLQVWLLVTTCIKTSQRWRMYLVRVRVRVEVRVRRDVFYNVRNPGIDLGLTVV